MTSQRTAEGSCHRLRLTETSESSWVALYRKDQNVLFLCRCSCLESFQKRTKKTRRKKSCQMLWSGLLESKSQHETTHTHTRTHTHTHTLGASVLYKHPANVVMVISVSSSCTLITRYTVYSVCVCVCVCVCACACVCVPALTCSFIHLTLWQLFSSFLSACFLSFFF